jgi:hypothetical protein
MPRRDEDPYRTAYEREKGKWDARRDARFQTLWAQGQQRLLGYGCLGLFFAAVLLSVLITVVLSRKPGEKLEGKSDPPAIVKKGEAKPQGKSDPQTESAHRPNRDEASDLGVELISAKVGPATLVDGGQEKPTATDLLALTIRVAVTNPGRTYDYRSWGLLNADAGTLTDQKGRSLKGMTRPDWPYPKGHIPKGTVKHGQALSDVLLFWPPEADASDLVLSLPILDRPGKALRLTIPKETWSK